MNPLLPELPTCLSIHETYSITEVKQTTRACPDCREERFRPVWGQTGPEEVVRVECLGCGTIRSLEEWTAKGDPQTRFLVEEQ